MQTFGRNIYEIWLIEIKKNEKNRGDWICQIVKLIKISVFFFHGNVAGKLMMCWNVRWFCYIDMNECYWLW